MLTLATIHAKSFFPSAILPLSRKRATENRINIHEHDVVAGGGADDVEELLEKVFLEVLGEHENEVSRERECSSLLMAISTFEYSSKLCQK